MLNPYAVFDSLFIGAKLQDWLGNVAAAEVHMFSYLSCLLSLYRGQPVAGWGYKFVGTEHGAPFSTEVDSAICQLLANGLLIEDSDLLRVSEAGHEECLALLSLSQNSQREAFLQGACSTVLALPVGVVREALHNEPELGSIGRLSAERILLEDSNPELGVLYGQLRTLSEGVGVEVDNLMIPAVVWLTYLSSFPETAGLDTQENQL